MNNDVRPCEECGTPVNCGLGFCTKTYPLCSECIEEEIEFAGKTTKYTYKGGSGMDAHVYSCPVCCTRVYGEAEAFDGMRSVVLGAFDDSLALEPKSEIFTNYKMKWIQDNGCIQESFEEAAIVERLSSLMQNLDQRA